ncbi:peptidoglycan-binding domain-containing protein [Streptomyces sp. NRRL S-1022]|uniref:peptidoglycan-binding domain-containing protein n=1 Tax=Streptomyces sp. NRRL S-1022 TaxID=1463880 RepID=UPI0004C04BB8|nr:peptidoglycan-binding protein [Streptomyces sp. NRRL S-1022]
MPDLWMPGATRLDIGDHAPTDGGPAKAVSHITWDRNATAAKPADLVPYEDLRSYFSGSGKGVAPHILWDPFGGRFTQFVPANSRSKSLVDQAGGTRTNRAGSVVIQVEALFFPYCRVGKQVYPRLVDTPCKGWEELHAWVHSWGVANAWPNGRPENCTRDEHTWETQSGWYPHKGTPENKHDDPLSWPAFPAAPAKPPAKPKVSLAHIVYAAKHDPAAAQGHTSHKDEVLIVERALKAEGLLAAQWVDGSFGTKTIAAYARWQRSPAGGGYVGSDADGIPGAASLRRLAARHGFTVTA